MVYVRLMAIGQFIYEPYIPDSECLSASALFVPARQQTAQQQQDKYNISDTVTEKNYNIAESQYAVFAP
jgi:hypothetical protein